MPDGRDWPKVTVVTPNYNYGDYLEETIRSVLLQGYPDLEYIVIDDGSTDGSVGVIRKYEAWLAHWQTGANRGQTAAINAGFRRASGDILAWLNSDDTYLPGALRDAAEAMRPGEQVVFGECRYVDQGGALVFEHSGAITARPPLGLAEWVTCWKRYPAPQPSVFWRRSLQEAVGSLDESFRYAMDYDLFLRFAERARFTHIPRALSTFRLHEASKTVSQYDKFIPEIERASRRYWGSRSSLRYWSHALSAWTWLHSIREAQEAITASRRSRGAALRHLIRCFVRWPFSILVQPRVVLSAVYRTVAGWSRPAEALRALVPPGR
jgi:glycosyltransferase involved in cell wall biosynthesis